VTWFAPIIIVPRLLILFIFSVPIKEEILAFGSPTFTGLKLSYAYVLFNSL
jgi:hypothetical protein